VIYVRVKDYQGVDRAFSIVINRWHDNVNAMFGEEKRLDPSKDTIEFVPPDFFDKLENFDGSETYQAKLDKFGVNRSDPGFWEAYDWFQKRLDESDPLQAGLYELNRYYPLAR